MRHKFLRVPGCSLVQAVSRIIPPHDIRKSVSKESANLAVGFSEIRLGGNWRTQGSLFRCLLEVSLDVLLLRYIVLPLLSHH